MTFHFLQNDLFREGGGYENQKTDRENSLAWKVHIIVEVSAAAREQSDLYMHQYMHVVSSHIYIKIVALMADVHLQAPGGTRVSQRQ